MPLLHSPHLVPPPAGLLTTQPIRCYSRERPVGVGSGDRETLRSSSPPAGQCGGHHDEGAGEKPRNGDPKGKGQTSVPNWPRTSGSRGLAP